jgi:hypothetical protein
MAAVVGVAAWASAASASAGTYAVWSCRGPAGEPVSAAAWTPRTVNARAGDVTLDDTCAQGGRLRVSLAAGRAFASSAVGMATFTAPPGTRIVGYEVWRSLAVAPPRLLRAYDYAAAVAEHAGAASPRYGCSTLSSACRSAGDPGDPLAPVNRVAAHAQPLDAVALQVSCERSWCDEPSGPAARAELYRARVLVEDTVAPATPRIVGGPSALVVSSSDVGAGIASMSMALDGGAARTIALPDCREPFVAAQPCPAAAAQSFGIDLGAGRHVASGTVTDAAGNTTAWGPVAFTVEQADPVLSVVGARPPELPVAPAAVSGRPAVARPKLRLATTSIVHPAGAVGYVKGTLRSAAGAPIAGARLSVTALELGVEDARSRALAPVTTNARGQFTARVRGDGARRVSIAFVPTPDAQPTAVASATVRTRLALTARPDPRALVKGRVVTVSGRLRGAGASARGAVVRVESIVNGRWAPVGTATARADGRYRWRYRFVHLARDTTFSFRTVLAHTPGWPWPTVRSPRFFVDVDIP